MMYMNSASLISPSKSRSNSSIMDCGQKAPKVRGQEVEGAAGCGGTADCDSRAADHTARRPGKQLPEERGVTHSELVVS